MITSGFAHKEQVQSRGVAANHSQRCFFDGEGRDEQRDAARWQLLLLPLSGRHVRDVLALVERVVYIDIEAFDWNCPQHITRRYTESEWLEHEATNKEF